MTSDVRYASGEVPQVGDVVERVEYPIGYLSLGDQVTVRRIVNERSIDVGSDAVHYGIKQFKLIRRAHHAQQPAPVETFVPVWGPEWEYVDRAGSIRQFEYRDVVGVQPIVLSCELLGISRYCEDGRYLVGDNPSHFDIVSQRPRTPAARHAVAAPEVAELRERCDVIVEAYRKHDQALAAYFACHGAEHDDDCPMDDTCDCPLLVLMRKTEAELRLAVQNYRDLTRGK